MKWVGRGDGKNDNTTMTTHAPWARPAYAVEVGEGMVDVVAGEQRGFLRDPHEELVMCLAVRLHELEGQPTGLWWGVSWGCWVRCG